MSPFTRYVSRKMLGAVAAFAVLAIVLAGFAFAGSQGSGSPTVDATTEAQAFQDALADPAIALDGSQTPGDTGATADPADPGGAGSELRVDLRAAFKLQGDARRQALADIRTKARDGGYGDYVEHRADRREIRRQLFFDLLPDNLQSDLQALKDAPADQRPQMRADVLGKALAGDYGDDVKHAAEQLQQLHQG